MTYIDTLHTYTSLTSPSSAWAPIPAVVCDFGWFNTNTNLIFGTQTYVVNGITYPPSGLRFLEYYTLVNQPVTFDSNDINALGIPKTIIPPGITVASYSWDLGNGVTGEGPNITTTYTYTTMPPDIAATLTIVDSLGRTSSTTHRLNLVSLTNIEGTESMVSPGTARVS